jgi:hypothetical protein
VRRTLSVAFALLLPVVATAHVGSPNVLYDGAAGAYPVRVIVRPPTVVPGLAEVVVRVAAADVRDVSIRPVFWRTGVSGAPSGDIMRRVPGQDRVFAGQLWLMAYGAYSVYVTVEGTRGSGTAIVPVDSFARGRLGVPRGLGAILVLLGVALVAGFVTLIRAAAGESLLLPGEPFDAGRRRHANSVAAIAVPIVALLLLGGAKWWQSTDAAYRRRMYAAPSAEATIGVGGTSRTLRLVLSDTAAFRTIVAPVAPDHGKMMHLFLVGDPAMETFAHLHPVETDSLTFACEVPWLPAGRYRLFGDITLENGTTLTVTNIVHLPAAPDAIAASDSDDAWTRASPTPIARGAVAPIGDGYTMAWTGSDDSIGTGTPVDLRFEVRDPRGSVVPLHPYLGMAGHAVVLRDDASVFIHLHPMGTVTTTAQQIFILRDRGDTTPNGRLRAGALSTATPSMAGMTLSEPLIFPYEFPKPGRYRVWVQIRPVSKILTGTFDVDVH